MNTTYNQQITAIQQAMKWINKIHHVPVLPLKDEEKKEMLAGLNDAGSSLAVLNLSVEDKPAFGGMSSKEMDKLFPDWLATGCPARGEIVEQIATKKLTVRCVKAALQHLRTVGNVANTTTIFHDFTEGFRKATE